MVAVRVQGLAVVAQEVAPVVLLREETGSRRWLAITIGAPEAQELAAAQEHVVSARPGTVELIIDVLGALGQQVERVEITQLEDSIFHADLVLGDGVRVSARPSDAIAIGLRTQVPLEVAEAVLDEAAVDVTVAAGEEMPGGESGEPSEDEIRRFRDLLDEVSPEDFRDPGTE
ncbi:bifunctional nuclease family protein [Amycolatopsis jiangsuensis]|nr:bifunctional nuclease family protein [Amycolatopsis jiangsuensis]